MGKRLSAVSALAVAAIGLGVSRGYSRFEVAEESMAPALLPGDYLVTRRLRGMPSRGEVVVYPHPQRSKYHLVKRVIGVGGEHVDIKGGQVHIDARPLAEPWANGPTLGEGTWSLAPDEVFVLGDNRALSADDSGQFGPIGVDAVAWRATYRYWPLTRAGRPAAG